MFAHACSCESAVVCYRVIVFYYRYFTHCTVNVSHSGLHMPTSHSDSDSAVSRPVTGVDAVTVHLHSQCSGACSDVQETAEVQS